MGAAYCLFLFGFCWVFGSFGDGVSCTSFSPEELDKETEITWPIASGSGLYRDEGGAAAAAIVSRVVPPKETGRLSGTTIKRTTTSNTVEPANNEMDRIKCFNLIVIVVVVASSLAIQSASAIQWL